MAKAWLTAAIIAATATVAGCGSASARDGSATSDQSGPRWHLSHVGPRPVSASLPLR